MAKRRKTLRKTTINVKSVCKDSTELNVSAAFVDELVTFLGESVIPTMVLMSEKRALRDGRKTLMEQDYLAMKDYVWYYLSMVSRY